MERAFKLLDIGVVTMVSLQVDEIIECSLQTDVEVLSSGPSTGRNQ